MSNTKTPIQNKIMKELIDGKKKSTRELAEAVYENEPAPAYSKISGPLKDLAERKKVLQETIDDPTVKRGHKRTTFNRINPAFFMVPGLPPENQDPETVQEGVTFSPTLLDELINDELIYEKLEEFARVKLKRDFGFMLLGSNQHYMISTLLIEAKNWPRVNPAAFRHVLDIASEAAEKTFNGLYDYIKNRATLYAYIGDCIDTDIINGKIKSSVYLSEGFIKYREHLENHVKKTAEEYSEEMIKKTKNK